MTENKAFVNLDESITRKSKSVMTKDFSLKEKGDIFMQTKKDKNAFLLFSMLPDSSIIFLVSASFYFEDFILISTKICVRSRTSVVPVLQK